MRDRQGTMYLGRPREAYRDPDAGRTVRITAPDRWTSAAAQRLWRAIRTCGYVDLYPAHKGAMSPPGTCERDVVRRVRERVQQLRHELYTIEKAMAVDGWTAFVTRPTRRRCEVTGDPDAQDAEEWLVGHFSRCSHVAVDGRLHRLTDGGSVVDVGEQAP